MKTLNINLVKVLLYLCGIFIFLLLPSVSGNGKFVVLFWQYFEPQFFRCATHGS